MGIKFGPTEVTETKLSRIRDGQLEIGGMTIEDIIKKMTYTELAKKLWMSAGADSFTTWPRPATLPLDHLFSLYSSEESVLQILRSVLPLIPTQENYWNDCAQILATMVSCVAAWGVRRTNISFDSTDSQAKIFLSVIRPAASKQEIKAFDSVMLVHAENELNLSTTGLRLAASAGASLREAIAAATGILSGPLHGGASAEVMKMLEEISNSKRAEAWIQDALTNKQKIMGFGHLLYKDGDPRALILKKVASDLASHQRNRAWLDVAEEIEAQMIKKKSLKPNIDFYSAVIYKMLNISKDLAVGIFAMSRMLGWALHYDEQKRVRSMITPIARFQE